MGMTAAEIQYALDRRGMVDIPTGTDLTDTVELAHLQGRIFVNNREGGLTWAGAEGRFPFEFNWKSSYSHMPCDLTFTNIDFNRNSVDQGGFLKVRGEKAPFRLSMYQCRFYAVRGYAIDGWGVGRSESLFFQDMQTYGSCAIRWIGNSSRATNWVEIDNWRHIGGGRIGASFMLENLRNVLGEGMIEDGTPSLTTACRDVYYGPLAVHIINCEGLNVIDDYWFEPWGTWDTVAPDCWGFTVRADETSGDHRLHATVIRNISLNATGLAAGTKLFHAYGGDSSNDAADLRVDFIDQFDLTDGSTLFGGKVMPVAKRAMNNSPYGSSDTDDFIGSNGRFEKYWQTTSFAHPYQVYADRVAYSASGYADTYTAAPDQPEDA